MPEATDGGEVVLAVSKLTQAYGGRTTVDEVSFALTQRTITGCVAPETPAKPMAHGGEHLLDSGGSRSSLKQWAW